MFFTIGSLYCALLDFIACASFVIFAFPDLKKNIQHQETHPVIIWIG